MKRWMVEGKKISEIENIQDTMGTVLHKTSIRGSWKLSQVARSKFIKQLRHFEASPDTYGIFKFCISKGDCKGG